MDDELDLNEEQSNDCMSTASASSIEEEDDQGSTVAGDDDSRKRKADEITNISVIDTEEVDAELPATEQADMGTNTKPRLGQAIIDHLTVGCKICLLSFDMEVGGEYCGPLSLSSEVIEFNLTPQS
jgi:hypothetical protein